MLPEDPLNTLQERVNRKLREGEPPPETGAAPSAPNRQRAGFDLTEVTICLAAKDLCTAAALTKPIETTM